MDSQSKPHVLKEMPPPSPQKKNRQQLVPPPPIKKKKISISFQALSLPPTLCTNDGEDTVLSEEEKERGTCTIVTNMFEYA